MSEKRDSLFVLDAHFDMPMEILERSLRDEKDIFRRYHRQNLRRGGIDCLVGALYVNSIWLPEMGLRCALDQISALMAEVESCPEDLAICRTMAEVDGAKREGKIALLLSLEGADPLGNDLRLLPIFHALGVRGLGLAWSRRNYAADGCWFHPRREGRKGGLTDFGVALVEEATRLGMWIDVSHLNDEGFWDVMELVKGPLIASHSNARALVPGMMRNLTDDQIRAIAERGGVIGLNALDAFIGGGGDGRRLLPDDLARHADHIARLVGIEHVGIGFDLCDGLPSFHSMPDGFPTYDVIENHGETGRFLQALESRGYSREQVALVAGGNFARVFRQILDRS